LSIVVIVIPLWFLNNCKLCVESRAAYRVVVGKYDGRDYLKDPGKGGRIIFRWIFRKWDVGNRLDQGGSG